MAGRELDVFLQEQFGFNFDEFTATNLQTIDDYLADVPIASDILDDFIELLNNYQETSDGDANGDGIPNDLDPTTDGDTPTDPDIIYDPNEPLPPETDIDHDGIPDWQDNDMDGDGIEDRDDADRDGDGIPDDIDPDPLTPSKTAEVSIEVSSITANEGDTPNQSAEVKVSLSSALLESIHISLSNGGFVEIPAGSTSADATITWNGDTIPEADEIIPVEILGFSYGGSETVVFGHDGSLSIADDDNEPNPDDPRPHAPPPPPLPRRDPLVLDMNQDGFISVVSLQDSNAYFDITGDGIKERVGWIAQNDGILAYDKNENGKIEGIDEVFGNQTISGFEELRQIADSNYDGIIDRRDELYSRLKVWQDANQDGISQSDELKTLSEAGVKNIELNVIGTDIEIEGNLLSEAGRYGDSSGDRELAADIQLTFDSRITIIDISTIPDYIIHPDSLTLPNLRGFGVVMDTSIAYNLNDTLRTMAKEYANNTKKVATEFDAFMAEWSGLTKQAGYQTWSLDRQQRWIYEQFLGSSINPRSPVFGVYTQLMERSKAFFALETLYPTLQEGVAFDRDINEFVVSDVMALHKNTIEFMNNPDESLERKLFLADVMNTLEKTYLVFDATQITASITNPLIKELVGNIYTEEYKAYVYGNGTYTSGSILAVGSEDPDVITINGSSGSTILAGEGDDVIHASEGNDVYLYRSGDGTDTIIDGGGSDTLRLIDMLQSDIVIRSDGKNLIIARAEDGKAFDELSDRVTLVNWTANTGRVENILFSDGSTLDFATVIREYFITEGNGTIDLTNSNDTVEMLGGNDTLNALGGDDVVDGGAGDDTVFGGDGNDTLIGGAGSDALQGGNGEDTYIYSRGDGSDTVIDSSGNDTLRFAEGVSSSDLVVRMLENGDMQIALKEDGKTFEELVDKITVKNWKNQTNRIENITLFDGSSVNVDLLQVGTDGNDNMLFGDLGVSFDALGGDDHITSGSGADTIDGGDGSDTLITGAGNDTLMGGKESDTIMGGMGNDTYIYNRSDGKDTITDSYTYGYNGSFSQNAGNDTIKLGAGITKDDLLVTIVGSDIVVALKEEGKTLQELTDIITIKNGTLANSAIENILLSDGTKLLIVDMQEATEQNDTLVFGDNDITVDALGGSDTIVSGNGNDTINGGTGNDTIRSNDGADILYGGDGADSIEAGRGDDTLSGGKESDTLMGDLGNDTYVYNRGEGKDTIIDSYTYGNAGNDTLRFGEGIAAEDIIAKAVGNDMLIALKEDGKIFEQLSDIITLKDWLDVNKRVENFTLADGTILTLTQMQQATEGDDYLTFGDEGISVDALGGNDTVISGKGDDTLYGAEGNDTLLTGLGDDTLYGEDGNDTLRSEEGNDILHGGLGDDLLQGGRGNDMLYGGSGADILEGGEGNDTYVFTRGDATNTLIDTAGNDTLRFADGITKEDILVKAVGKDIIIALAQAGKNFEELSDKVVMKNWLDSAMRVENIMLADGTSLNLSDISTASEGDDYLVFGDEGVNVSLLGGNDTLISGSGDDTIGGGVGNDTITTNSGADTIYGEEGNDTIDTGDGHDTIDGGEGYDTIYAGKGNDTIIGVQGNDVLMGDYGDDTYIFNIGDGYDTLFDTEGSDTLRFGDAITKDDLLLKQNGYDLLVTLKEDGKNFNELSDKVLIQNWFKGENNIETFVFADGSTLLSKDIAALFVNVNIEDTLFSKAGAMMRGEQGDDIYVYSRGDFKVIIDDYATKDDIEIDAGYDTLQFSSGITKNDVKIGVNGNNLIIEIIGSHDTYEQLKDYVVVKDWKNENRGIEKIVFSDGEVLEILKTETFPSVTFDNGWTSNRYYVYGSENNTMTGSPYADKVEVGGGDDTVNADAGNDTVYGGIGDDNIDGGSGNDTFVGGAGADYLRDGAGDDTYVYSRGDGRDIIYDTSGNDTLRFADGITKEDIIIKQYGNTMVVGLKDGDTSFYRLSDKITIRDWYISGSRIETFAFSDGSTMGIDEIVSSIGTDKNDTIYGVDSRNDTLIGAKGNDTLLSGAGDDVFVFNRGDAKDTIVDTAGLDTIKFGIDINAEDIVFERVGNNLVVALAEEGRGFEELKDTITVKDWYASFSNRVEFIEFFNGTKLVIADEITNGTEAADSLAFGAEANTVNALGGNDTVTAGDGNDTVDGGIGNDTLWGNYGQDNLKGGDGDDTLFGDYEYDSSTYTVGNDTLTGGVGADTLKGGGGDDTYIFNRGDGKDYIYDNYGHYWSYYGYGINWQSAGNDTLKFGDGITADDLVLKQNGNQLLVALKEDGKTFEQLSDVVTLENFSYNTTAYYESSGNYNAYFGIENFVFSNGTTWKTADIMSHIGTDANDVIYGLNNNDTIHGGKGDDTLYGRVGDDTYIFNRGDGRDTIFDDYGTSQGDSNSGNDTLKLGDGITADDLIIQKSGNDVIVAIKEDGVEFISLTDKVTLKDWYNVNNKIENLVLSDGTAINLAFLYEPTEEADNLTFGAEDNVINALSGNDTIYGGAGNDTISGGDGDDNLQGQDGEDIVSGDVGNDTLYGQNGNDTMDGEVGNDTLYGGANNDTYLFGRGDGADTIIEETAYNRGGIDTLKFKEGITADNIIIKQVRDIGYGIGEDLVIALKEDGKTFAQLRDKITIQNGAYYYEYYGYDYTNQSYYDYRVENFEFSDGTIWSFADLIAHTNSDENETIHGFNGADTISGGKGNDTLKGYQGNDTYIFNLGDGKDTIYDYGCLYNDYNYYNGGNDTLKFGEGITQEDLVMKKDGSNLIIALKEDGVTFEDLSNKVTIISWYNGNNRIENFELADGTIVSQELILRTATEFVDQLEYGAEDNVINALGGNDLVYAGAGNDTISGGDGDDNLQGQDGDDTISGDASNDTLYGQNGNDTMDGGVGNDTLYGQNGNDVLDGRTGNDTLYGGVNNDTYLFGRGDGVDKIIEETAYNSGGIDTLRFKDGITADDIIIKQVRDEWEAYGLDLVIALKEDGKTFAQLRDKITIQNGAYYYEYYGYDYTNQSSYDYRVENFEFSDGTIWSFADLIAHTNSDENETIHGFNGADTISGGKGDDTLSGHNGNDTYIFNRSDGKDTIYDYGRYQYNYSYYNAGSDTLKFGEEIDKSDIIFYMNGNNLVIDCKNSDAVTITNQNNDYNAIEKIMLSDGSYLTNIDIQRVVTDLAIYAQENNLDISNAEAIRLSDELVELFNSSWNDAQTSGNYTPPLVLDLNQNDQTSIALADSHAYFDYDGDGKREHTAWMESGDALLAVDLNGDGAITNGGELFGDFTKLQDGSFAQDGYEALAQYDSNGDNIIDKNDARFGELLLWRDDNRDGKSTSSEIINIALSSITAIHLSREEGISFEAYTENGNIITNETLYNGYNSTTGSVRDVWFEYDDSDTITNNDTLVVTKQNDLLIGEDGNDTYIYKMGNGMVTIDDQDATQQGIDKLVFGTGITKNQLVVKWDRGTDDIIIGVHEHVEDETALNQLNDKIVIKNWFNANGLIETFTFTDGTTLDRETIYTLMLDVKENSELTLRVLDENGELVGGGYNDVLYGMSGSEVLQGKNGDDYLMGYNGDDYLDGGRGDDVLVGGKGDDTLIGESGDDFYIYEKGNGRDTIIDAEGYDTLFFGEGITHKDVMFEVIGDDMKITFAYDAEISDEQRDRITIKNWQQNGFEIENLEFVNGETYTIPELIEKNTNHAPTTLFAESSYMLTDISIQTGIVLARDIDGDTLNYTVSTAPENGILSVNKYGIWTYTSNDKYKGFDSAVITVDDGNGLSSTKTLNFEVVITNVDPIILEAQTDVILQDIREQTGQVQAADADGDVLTYTVSTQAQHGTLSVDAEGEWIYSVEGTYIGADFAVITVDDAQGGSVNKTLNFDAKVSAPELILATFDTLEDTVTAGVLSVANPVGGVLVYEILSSVVNGDFDLDANGNWNYMPNTNYNGNDTVMLKVTNEYGLSTISTLVFDIEAVNDAPTVQNPLENVILKDSVTYDTKLNATDIDGDILNYTISSMPQHGDIFIDKDGLVKYSVDTTYRGTDSLSITIDDGNGLFTTKTFNLTIDNHVINDDKNRNKLYGTNATDIMNGLSGNDRLYGYDGDDFLYGGRGKDKIYGAQGNDTLVGGVGNDVLEGYNGSDIYYFNKGDGRDTVEDYSQKRSNDIDKIVFGKEVSKDDISFIMNHGDLLLQYGDNDTIKVKYQDSQRNQIERIELSDGNYLTNDDIDLVIQQINAYGSENDICHISNKDIQDNAQLMNIVTSAWNI